VSTARRACRILAALLAASATAETARAETLYVIEQLVVTVNSAPDGGERVASVKSGDRLEVLERIGDVVHVRLASGKDGWVGARYLTSDEPLRPQLAQRDAQVAQLKEEVSRLQGELTAARAPTAAAAPAAASSAANTAPAAPAAATSAAQAGGPPAEPLFTGASDETPPRLWPWALSAALAGLFLGFALGALVLDRRIRRKYGGLRIY
jgi:hypothetical protein